MKGKKLSSNGRGEVPEMLCTKHGKLRENPHKRKRKGEGGQGVISAWKLIKKGGCPRPKGGMSVEGKARNPTSVAKTSFERGKIGARKKGLRLKGGGQAGWGRKPTLTQS